MPSDSTSSPAASDLLRSRARAARRALTGAARDAAQARIVEALAGLADLRHPARVALYLPTDGEVDLAALHPLLRDRGAEVLVPVVGPDTTMVFRPLTPGVDLVPNRHGVAEPVGDGSTDVGAGDVDVVLVPCVAVDPDGRRLGFGAGYYDRALAGAATAGLRVGVAFDCQVVAAIEVEPWDVPMDLVVTESGVSGPGR